MPTQPESQTGTKLSVEKLRVDVLLKTVAYVRRHTLQVASVVDKPLTARRWLPKLADGRAPSIN